MSTHPSETPANLLIVEDSPTYLTLLVRMLQHRGYQVSQACNGEEALALARQTPPDLVLLDINMPGMDGYTVCEQLKADETLKEVPVIFLSGLQEVMDKVRAFSVGGEDYITKPFQFEEVQARVRVHLELRRKERQLQESYRQLKELERLRDSFVHMIVHDMRSPLATVALTLEMLQISPPMDPATASKLIQNAGSATKNLVGMINHVLDISRLEAGQMPLDRQELDLVTTLQTTVDSLAAVAKTRRMLLTSTGPCNARYDPDLVGRVVANLLANAIKFTSPDGEIRLSASVEGGWARVEVTDNGRGIAPEYQSRIFMKFGQADASDKRMGTGLGLAFCRLAVEAHGGQIGLTSEVGHGSTFWFTLPQAAPC